jgi:hypothetical protein
VLDKIDKKGDKVNKCCRQEENLQLKFRWVARSKDDEGDYEPVFVYCTMCGTIVKDISCGGYWANGE